ncbi:MAG TPA: tripartite tricarboxylate transporter substrate-binding protein [Usitatibacter sp.]|jgi:tripartite-type tricarboxylate transporter receptor subunit TctC|nr:tripartite tricarboxylate transporter substrate-binding protein [Usitatibacter sp.]
MAGKKNIAVRMLVTAAAVAASTAALAWEPTKPIEFVGTAGAGGGTDIFARTVQSIIQKHKLVSQPIVVESKGGGSGAEGYMYVKNAAGDPYRLVFGTSNTWQQPILSNVPYKHTDFTPVAAMVNDEFLLWVKGDSPYKTAGDVLKGMKAKNGDWRMGGALSKDTDEMLTHLIEKAGNVKVTFIPYKSGGETAVQLAGGHIDSQTNNPSESIGQWKAGTQRPVCVFNTQRLPSTTKVTATESWHDIPTCKEQGLDVGATYQQPRTVWLPGKVKPEEQAYWVEVMRKVQATPEWKEYVERTSQTSTFAAGKDLEKLIQGDLERTRKIGLDQGWVAAR